jgi:hypothetical protein
MKLNQLFPLVYLVVSVSAFAQNAPGTPRGQVAAAVAPAAGTTSTVCEQLGPNLTGQTEQGHIRDGRLIYGEWKMEITQKPGSCEFDTVFTYNMSNACGIQNARGWKGKINPDGSLEGSSELGPCDVTYKLAKGTGTEFKFKGPIDLTANMERGRARLDAVQRTLTLK